MSADKKKVLITGADGQLGHELVKVFQKDWVVIATDTHNLDITDKSQVQKVVSKEKPALVIHCAAWTNVDAAAEDPEGAMRVNGQGTKNVCEAAKKIGARIVYISTNEVFDGEKKTPYTEDDEPNPINSYGKSKLAGEKYCQEILGKNCVIVRSSWLYGTASVNNFPNKILRKAKEQGFLRVVDDEVATPTYTPDLAKGIKKLVEKDTSRTLHLINEGQASRYEWAKQIVGVKNLKVSIEPIKIAYFQRASEPPKYSVLDTTKAKKAGLDLRGWQEASKEYITTLVS